MKLFIIIAFIATLYAVNGKTSTESCKTPRDEDGTCIVLNACEILVALVRKAYRTPQEFNLLRKSHCGFDGSTPKVCCPNSCTTSEGQPGVCTDINLCPHMMTQQASSNQTTECQGPALFSVCCSLSHVEPITIGNCDTRITAYPPESTSSCCGITTYASRFLLEAPEIDQYPWLAVIEYTSPEGTLLLCGGTLISSKYVLTAAHCVTGKILDRAIPTNVRLGDHDISNDGIDCTNMYGIDVVDCADPTVTIPIETIAIHEEFKPNSRLHDIAIIRLKDSAPYTDFIRPLCLPTKNVVIPTQRTWVKLAGWELETLTNNSVKQHEHLSYVALDSCQKAFRNHTTLSDSQICATGDRRSSCIGNSGWPLIKENHDFTELVGIASFGGPRCYDEVPGVYTKVFSYLDWIKSKIVS